MTTSVSLVFTELPVAQAGSGGEECPCLERKAQFQGPDLPPASEESPLLLHSEPGRWTSLSYLPCQHQNHTPAGRDCLTKRPLPEGFHQTSLWFRNSLFCQKVHFCVYLNHLTMIDSLIHLLCFTNLNELLNWKLKLLPSLACYYSWL